MAVRVFDTYASGDMTAAMITFLNSLSEKRILCFAVAVSVF